MTTPNPQNNDELVFAEESSVPESPGAREHTYWQVLIADDDHEIHNVTRLALSGLEILGRPLNFISAYTAEETIKIVQQHPDVALVLLDVVMENDHAGLHAVERIRQELNNHDIRIILRTGQPGYAPEERVVLDYDINDYKTKNELTRAHLVTSVVAAIRSFQQISTINQNRHGLQKIIQAGSNLMELTSLRGFADGVVTQIASLLGLRAEGVLCARIDDSGMEGERVHVIGSAGQYAEFLQCELSAIPDPYIVQQIETCLAEQQHQFAEQDTTLFVGSGRHAAAVYIRSQHPIADQDRQLIEVFLHNITIGYENITLFQQLRHAAYIDPLTRLPNRNEFIRLLEDCARQANAHDHVAILIDLDHFSDINDGLGQEIGNLLLQAVAQRLRGALGDVVLARVDADVFGLVGHNEHLQPEHLLGLFELAYTVLGQALPVGITMGIARFNTLGEHGMTMLKRTNIALNIAKNQSEQRYVYYDPNMEKATEQRIEMAHALRKAYADEGLAVWYQPQIDISTRAVIGLEALLRWPQSDGSMIGPDVFIPVAEYSGLIIDLGEWVLNQACMMLKRLEHAGYKNIRIAVNVSMPQFRQTEFPAQVARHLKYHGVNPQQIELEITESVIMDEPETVVTVLRKLKTLGIQIALDDFGTGFSSLNYLRQLPLDRIKVDRSFVQALDRPSGAIVAETIVRLGQRLNLQTIAEGIENERQEQLLHTMGCAEAQGFLYAKPLPPNDLMDFLNTC